MDWEREIELAVEGAARVTITLDALEELLAEQLSKEEILQLAEELSRRAESALS